MKSVVSKKSVQTCLGSLLAASTLILFTNGAHAAPLANPSDNPLWKNQAGNENCECILDDSSVRVFPATLRDFKQSHPDFEYELGSEKNIVKDYLGSDGLPVYNGNPDTLTTTGEAAFDQWYRDVSDVNKTISMTFEMTKNQKGYWEYSNFSFFPLDNMGWGNERHRHNYHFTLETHLEFHYSGGEVFTFVGDDDLWIFINGKKVIDLGGVHTAENQTIHLDALAESLGIEVGNTYSFDLFFAERHTVASEFSFQTSLELECKYQ